VDLLEKKYKNVAKELVWQWFFPGKTLTFVPETEEYRRYHLHHTHVLKARSPLDFAYEKENEMAGFSGDGAKNRRDDRRCQETMEMS